MLNTIKQMKGVFNFDMYFAGPESKSGLEGKETKRNDISELLSLQQVENLNLKMFERKKEILNFVKSISGKDINDGNISLEDVKKMNLKNPENIFQNLKEISDILKISYSDNSIPYITFYTHLESYTYSAEHKRDVEEVKTESKEKRTKVKKDVEGKVETSEINDEVVKNFDLTKDFSDKIKVIALQKALGITADGYIGAQTVRSLDAGKKLVGKPITRIEPKEFKESDKTNSKNVALLQYSLVLLGANLIVDGKFGPKTKEALANALKGKISKKSEETNSKKVDKNIEKKSTSKVEKSRSTKQQPKLKDRPEFSSEKEAVVSSQFTDEESRKNEVPLYEDKKVGLEETRAQVEKTGKAIDHTAAMLEATKELNGRLEEFLYRDKTGYSIAALVKRIFKGDKYNEIIGNKDKYNEIMSNPQAKAKIDQAMNFLFPPRDTRESDDNTTRWRNETLGSKVMKFIPWVFGIYLGDIPLPIMKEMLPGADVKKSQSFMNWIEKGLPGSFEDYYKQNKVEVKPIKEMVSLQDLLSRTELTTQEQARILSGDLSGIDQKTKNLLLTYLEVNLIPNLKILRDGAFNAAEQGKWYTLGGFFGLAVDKKSKELSAIIKDLEIAVENKNLSIKGVDKALQLLSQEANKKTRFISPADFGQETLDKVQAGHNYAERIANKNREIQAYFGNLSKLGDRVFNDYNRMFALKNFQDLSSLGLRKEDLNSVKDFIDIVKTGNSTENDIIAWEKANPSASAFLKALGNENSMQNYLINSIPRRNDLKYVNVGKGNLQDSSHGRDLSGLSNAEALNAAESETPDKGANLSTLGLAYKSFIEKGDLSGISYDEFRSAFANKTNVPISEMTKENVVNTGRNKNQGKLTNFSELAKQRGDTHVFKLAPIQKTYTYYGENGQEVTITASYDLYMRQDCTNPVLVPNTVNVKKEGKPVPEGEFISLMQVKGKLPVVIPWFLFYKPNTPPPTTKVETSTSEVVNSFGKMDATGAATSSNISGSTSGVFLD